MRACGVRIWFFSSSRRRHTMCALVTGVQTCALPIFDHLVSGNPVVAADDYAQWNVRLGQGAQPARPVCAAFCAEAIQRTDSKLAALLTDQIGRASCRERVCQYV